MTYLIATLSVLTTLFMPDIIKPEDLQPASQTQKPLIKFGILADVQFCNCDPVGNRYYRSSPAKLNEAMASLKKDSASFLVNLGDLIEKDYESFDPVLKIIKSSGLRIYHCTGNHDYSVAPELKKRLPLTMPSKKGYYSFSQNNFRFIFLNGNELSTYAADNEKSVKEAEEYIQSLKKEGNINAIDWNGGISNRQLVWLENQLDESVADNEKVFIFCHFPVYPENVHNLLNYRDVLAVTGKYRNIVAWFSGHNHAGNYGKLNTIHFITIKGMVETETTGSFAMIEVYSEKLQIKGYGREKEQTLPY